MFNTLSQRILLSIVAVFGLLHVVTLGQVPPVGGLEGWYVDPAYTYYKFGAFYNTMFPDLIEFQNGPFGQGKLRYLLQAYSFDLLGFGLYQARFPMVLGGLLSAYLVYLTGHYLFNKNAGLWGAGLYLLSPAFYYTHGGDSHSWLAVCFILSVYFFLRSLSEGRSIFAFATGLTIGTSVNFHLTGSLGVISFTMILFYYRLKKEVGNAQVFYYLLGGLAAFIVWCSFEILPIGLDAFLKKSSYGVGVAQSGGYVGSRWVNYFGGRGIIELPLLLFVLGSYKLFWRESRTRFFYLFFSGLFIAYTLFTGSWSIIPVWAVLFVLVGGLTSKLLNIPAHVRPLLRHVWVGMLSLVLLYYVAVQTKRAYDAFWIKAGDHYTELTSKIAGYIPEGKTVMGSPLYFFRFAGRNPYITQNFYWERMDKQTHELGVSERQPMAVRTQRMIAFLKRRNVEYLIADVYFREALEPWIPEDQWNRFFTVVGELQSPIYGMSSRGGSPPYKIQVWRMAEGGAP